MAGIDLRGSSSSGNAASGADAVTTIAASGTAQTLTLGSGGTGTWDITLTGNLTPTFAGATAGKACVWTMVLRQDATGSRTVSWPLSVAWQAQSAPSLSSTSPIYDIVQIVTLDGGTTFTGMMVAGGVKPNTVPAQVTGLSASPGATVNGLSWVVPNNGGTALTNYKIYRSTTTGTETLLTTISAASASYTDTGLTNGTTYFYKVSAVNAIGEGAQSAEASGTPAALGSGPHYLNLTGASGSRASATNSAAFQIANNLDIRVMVSLASWAPATAQGLYGKWSGEHYFYVDTTGKLGFAHYTADVTGHFPVSTVATGFAANSTNWVRVTQTVSGGTGTTTFYTSSGGVTWTQLGTPVTYSTAATALNTATAVPTVGAQSGGTADMATGKVYYTQVLNNGVAASTVDWSNATAGATTVVAATGESWTVSAPASIV